MSSDIKVAIDGDSVNAHVAKAILESKLGSLIEASLNKKIEELVSKSWSSSSVIDKLVEGIVSDKLKDEITLNHSDAMDKAVREKVTDAFIENLVTKLWDIYWERLRR